MRDYLTEPSSAEEGGRVSGRVEFPHLRKTNFLTTPLNPNLAHTVRTITIVAHRVRPQIQILIYRGVSFY